MRRVLSHRRSVPTRLATCADRATAMAYTRTPHFRKGQAKVSQSRRAAMQQWLETILEHDEFSFAPASTDASFRSYWRLNLPDGATRIIMDAPPMLEDITPWLDIGTRLQNAGLHVPQVYAADAAQGFVLMEDLGMHTFLTILDDSAADRLYGLALDGLVQMQRRVATQGLPHYDDALLLEELEMMPVWFLDQHLGRPASATQQRIINAAHVFLLESAAEQPTAFVHRDYHSRNLLQRADGRMAIIDYQDGLRGPVTYDLVSLLRDSYVRWPAQRVAAWRTAGQRKLVEAGVIDADVDETRFARWFDLIGVQRQLKVLGVFCRLWYRDGKGQYLPDLPMTWHYLDGVCAQYAPLQPLRSLLREAIGTRDLTVPRPAQPL